MVKSTSKTDDIDLDDLAEGKSSGGLRQFKDRRKKTTVSSSSVFMVVLAVFLFLAAVIVWFIDIFLNASIKDEWKYTSIEKFIMDKWVMILEKYRTQFKKYPKNDIDSKLSNIEDRKLAIKKYINDNSILFYDRKKIMNTRTEKEISKISSIDRELKNNQELISKYKYIPKDIEDFIESNKMLEILKVVESIRIYVLGKVYNTIKFNDSTVDESAWKYLVLYGEKWVEDYVQNCILNYMTENCEIWASDNDFGIKLEELIKKKTPNLNGDISDTVIKRKIKLLQNAYRKAYKDSNDTEDKLKPIQMLFNNFDPIEWTLSFTLQIRLLDNYLSDKVNHTVIVTDIINLLRESHLILGKNIKVNEITTEKRKLKIQAVTNIVYETNFNFVIDLQEDVQKEIYDYVDR